MIRSFRQLNKKNIVQSLAQQTLVPIYNITVSRTFLAHSVMLGGVNVVDWAFSATTGCNAHREHNIICHAELVSASNEPEIPKQARNDKKSEMRGAAHVDKQPGEFLRANRCYLQGAQYIYPKEVVYGKH